MTTRQRRSCAGRGFSVAAALVCALLLGPGVSRAAEEAEATARTNLQVTLWSTGSPGEKKLLSELVFSFQRSNPDVVVALEWKDREIADEWMRRWCDGYREYAPDVTVMTELWAREHRDALMELPDDLADRLRDDFEPSVLRRARGAPRGVPWAVATYALYYRADLLEEAGLSVPQTPEELVECARELADPPRRYGLGVPGPGGGGETLLHALALAHGPLREEGADGEDDSQGEDDEEGDAPADPLVEALELLVEMQASGALQPELLTWSESELVELLADGRLAMVIAGPRSVRTLRAAEEEDDESVDWAVAPMPMTENGVGQIAVDWLVVFENTDRPENAMRFLRYIAEQESQRALAMRPGVPATRVLAEELSGTQPWSGFIAGLPGARGVPLSTWDRWRRELADAFGWAISGRLTPSAAVERAW